MSDLVISTHLIPRLITIGISHYCEKARWALERLGIPYVEERHLPPFHRLSTKPVGGISVPVLITEAGTFVDSDDILHHLDTITSSGTRLYPNPPELRCEVDELEHKFNIELGPFTRCWAYFYLLNDWRLMQKLWCGGAPRFERIWFPIVFPWTRKVVRRMYNITPNDEVNSYKEIQRIFEMVGDRLSDGRTYLVGKHFSAADLTFACLAAPTVFPTEYGVKPPQLRELPSKMAEEIRALRETPAGKYVLRLYRERRKA